jgi:hypothetical protein
MKALLAGVLLTLGIASAAAQDQPDADAEYQELLKAYSTAAGVFRTAETDSEQIEAVKRFSDYPQQFLNLAEKHSGDPVALLALRQAIQAVISVDSQTQYCWELNRRDFPVGIPGDSAGRIVEILLRDHQNSDQLLPICDRMRYGARPEFEAFLNRAMEASPHRSVAGLSCLALAQLLKNQRDLGDRVAARPDWITRYDAILGREYFQLIRGDGRAALEERIDTLLQRAAAFDDVVNFSFSETVAEKAKTELFDLGTCQSARRPPTSKATTRTASRSSSATTAARSSCSISGRNTD